MKHKRIFKRLLLCALLGACATVSAGEVLIDFPESVDPLSHYVIYSHGRIVEGTDPVPVSDRWGLYDFPAIKKQLSNNSRFVLIAHHRPFNTDIDLYAAMLESWVRRLIENGVEPANISLVGFSKGGEITARTSSALKPLPINTVLLATCWSGGAQDREDITLTGRFLSIYETTDMALSCKALADRSDLLGSFHEIAITTGKEHGAFFKPLAVWLDPLKEWIEHAVAPDGERIYNLSAANSGSRRLEGSHDKH